MSPILRDSLNKKEGKVSKDIENYTSVLFFIYHLLSIPLESSFIKINSITMNVNILKM